MMQLQTEGLQGWLTPPVAGGEAQNRFSPRASGRNWPCQHVHFTAAPGDSYRR